MTNGRATCTAAPWLSIVGIGEDGADGLSPVAQKLIAAAELVVGGKRHLGLAGGLIRGRKLAWPSPIAGAMPEIEKHRGRPVVVLASGDPFHYGVGDMLLRSIPAAETLCLPQSSSFSLAAARLGWSLQDVALVSLHGRALEGIVRHLQPGARVLALSWDGETPSKLATLLAGRGMGGSSITVLEAMGGSRERVRRTTAKDFDLGEIAPLNTIALEVTTAPDATVLGLAPGLDDTLFEHDGQITKREARAVRSRRWRRVPASGCGISARGLARSRSNGALCGGTAIAIEAREDRAAKIRSNAGVLGASISDRGEARARGIRRTGTPDAVFIGGGLSISRCSMPSGQPCARRPARRACGDAGDGGAARRAAPAPWRRADAESRNAGKPGRSASSSGVAARGAMECGSMNVAGLGFRESRRPMDRARGAAGAGPVVARRPCGGRDC